MDITDQNRTFLFEDELDHGDRNPPTNCRNTRTTVPDGLVDINNPGGTTIQIIGRDGDVPTEPEVPSGTHDVGRFPGGYGGVVIMPGGDEEVEAAALTFPDFKERKVISWKGQQFGAYSTMWEQEYSPLSSSNNLKWGFSPVVDECGTVVGYYQVGVDTHNLFATPDGQIFFSGSDIHGGPTVLWGHGCKSIAGQQVWLTTSGKFAADKRGTLKLTPKEFEDTYHQPIPDGNRANILVDLDGFVLTIYTYLYPPPFEVGFWESPAGIFLGLIIPRVPEECMPGGDSVNTGYCQFEQFMAFAGIAFLFLDIVSLGTALVAYVEARAALKALLQVRRASTALHAVEGTEKLLKAGAEAATLALDVGKVAVEETATATRNIKVGDLVSLPRARGASRTLTSQEMEAFLRQTLRDRPYLARLRLARRLDGPELTKGLMNIIDEWGRATGKFYKEVPEGFVRRVGSMGADGWALDSISGREVLIIESQVAQSPRQFLSSVTHELAYEAVREAEGVPALANENLPIRFAHDWLENVIVGGEEAWSHLRGAP